MKLLVEKLVNGKTEFELVYADSAPQAINKCDTGSIFEAEELKTKELGFMGVYEVGETNLLDLVTRISDIHSFYHKKLEELGIDPLTFKKKQGTPE